MDDNTVGLAGLRKQRELSQEQLAELAGVSQATISRIEKDEYEPSLQILLKIARALEIDVRDFVPQNRLNEIFGRRPTDQFYAFCPNPLCDRNEHGMGSDGVVFVQWASGRDYPIERYEEVNFCSRCGADLIKECPNCGTLVEDRGSEYCISCGSQLHDRPTSEEWDSIRSEHDSKAVASGDEIPF